MSFGPLVVYAVGLVALYLGMGGKAVAFFATLTAGCFIGAGKLVIFAGALEGAPLGVAPIAALVVYTDAAVALLLLAHLEAIDRVPVLGPRLAQAHQAAWAVVRGHRWLRRLMWVGVALFVAVPFQGTGAVIGVFLGRILGLSRLAILASITFGSAAGSIPLAIAGRFGRARILWLADNPSFGVAALLVVLVLTIWFGRWITKARPDSAGLVAEPVPGDADR
jgi:uncharacterized membrane protein